MENSFLGESFLSSRWLDPGYLFDRGVYFLSKASDFIRSEAAENGFYFVLAVLAIILLFFLAYTIVRVFEIRAKEHRHLHHEQHEYARYLQEEEKRKLSLKGESRHPKWDMVLNNLFSPNQNDWKLAIIEADTMLEELTDQLGFKGENLGEKLKSADRDRFRNLSLAWEAHIVRNRIAHEGLSFQLSQHEAKRVIALFEQVFREFGFI